MQSEELYVYSLSDSKKRTVTVKIDSDGNLTDDYQSKSVADYCEELINDWIRSYLGTDDYRYFSITNACHIEMSEIKNADFQWKYDSLNQVIYCAHRDPVPSMVTVRYVPEFQDVSEIVEETYINYLIRMSLANMKIALGRTRSKYTIEGSNVSLDGEILLQEGNEELSTIREELGQRRNRMVIVN